MSLPTSFPNDNRGFRGRYDGIKARDGECVDGDTIAGIGLFPLLGVLISLPIISSLFGGSFFLAFGAWPLLYWLRPVRRHINRLFGGSRVRIAQRYAPVVREIEAAAERYGHLAQIFLLLERSLPVEHLGKLAPYRSRLEEAHRLITAGMQRIDSAYQIDLARQRLGEANEFMPDVESALNLLAKTLVRTPTSTMRQIEAELHSLETGPDLRLLEAGEPLTSVDFIED